MLCESTWQVRRQAGLSAEIVVVVVILRVDSECPSQGVPHLHFGRVRLEALPDEIECGSTGRKRGGRGHVEAPADPSGQVESCSIRNDWLVQQRQKVDAALVARARVPVPGERVIDGSVEL